MKTNLKPFAPIALLVGVVGLLVAGGIWAVQQQFDVYAQAALAIGALGLALAVLFNPEALLSRQGRYGGNSVLMTAALLGILVLVNILAKQNPFSWDLSQDKIGSLAPESVEAMKKLPGKVTGLFFYTADSGGFSDTNRGLLDRYYRASEGRFEYQAINADQEPLTASQYEVTKPGLLLQLGEEEQFIENFSVNETEVTAALIRLANPVSRSIYFLTGHGELSIEAGAGESIADVVDTLRKQNYTIAPLNLLVTSTIPADAQAIVIVGPAVPVSAAEADLLKAYQERGGAVVVLLDPLVQPGINLEPGTQEPLVDYLTATWGINLPQDLIVDVVSNIPFNGQAQPSIPASASYGTSQITDRLSNIISFFPLARSVIVPDGIGSRPDITYTPLVNTSDRAWGETDLQNPAQGPDDTAAPIYLGLAAENPTTKARLVVFGDSDFVADSWNQQIPGSGNANLFLNSINWVVKEETFLNLTVKQPTQRTLKPSTTITTGLIALLVIIVMPFSVLVLGGITWYLRRKHK